MWGNLFRVIGWGLLWILLFWVSRANHPTAMLNASATTLMIVASVAAFAVIARNSNSNSAAFKFGAVALSIVCAGVLVALAIGAVYDVEIGPDPRRFSLAANIVMDTVVVAILVALMGALNWGLRCLGFESQS